MATFARTEELAGESGRSRQIDRAALHSFGGGVEWRSSCAYAKAEGCVFRTAVTCSMCRLDRLRAPGCVCAGEEAHTHGDNRKRKTLTLCSVWPYSYLAPGEEKGRTARDMVCCSGRYAGISFSRDVVPGPRDQKLGIVCRWWSGASNATHKTTHNAK